ncbi:MAG: hypothetical protein ABW025_15235 [Cellulomonas sp.]
MVNAARPGTTHDDLMDLASRSAYDKSLAVKPMATVNGRTFRVVEITGGTPTGLDAVVFENTETSELTIAFQGTADLRDVVTDLSLATSATDAQFTAAVAYLDDVTARRGAVSTVTGNSLGGGLAAYVAVQRPELRAVTVNPAPVPAAYRGLAAPNVTNYVSTHDVLDSVITAAGMRDGVLGDLVVYPGTSRNLAFLLANHVGSDRGDPDDTPYDASMAVPFSLFHADTVVGKGGFGDRVDLDPEALTLMARGLDRRLQDVAAVLKAEVQRVSTEVGDHERDLSRRLDAMEGLVREALDARSGPVRRLLQDVVAQVDRYLRSPLVSMPPPPVALRPAWSLHSGTVRELLSRATELVDPVLDARVRDLAADAFRPVAELFEGESFHLARDMREQTEQLGWDAGLVARRWAAFSGSAHATVQAITRADASVARAIAAREAPAERVVVPAQAWPPGEVEAMTSSPLPRLHRQVCEVRQVVAGQAVLDLVASLHAVLAPWRRIAQSVSETLAGARLAVDAAAAAVRLVVQGLTVTPAGLVGSAVGADSGVRRFVADVDDLRDGFRRWVGEIEHEILDVLRALDSVPDLAHELGPELRATFLADATLEQARDALAKCHNVVAASEVAFWEVDHQLGDHEARAVDALARHANQVRTDLTTTRGNLQAMIA